MVVPVGRVVELTVVSPDVIHSWWVPALGGKIDAIPGQTNHTWFQAEKTGHYEVRCAELCGLEHAHMTGWVDVVTPAAVHGASSQRAPPGTRRSATRSSRASARRATGWRARATTARRSRAARSSATRRRSPTSSATARTRCRAVGATWDDATMKAATDYLKEHCRVAVRRRAAAVPRRLEARPRHRLADHRRPQADRDPLHRHEPRLLRRSAGSCRSSCGRSSRRRTSTS